MPPVSATGDWSSSRLPYTLMRRWLERTSGWFIRNAGRYVKTLDLFPEYITAIYHAWHDYLWEALLLAPVIIWWMLGSAGNPPMWIVALAFVWALLMAGYYTWRAEHVRLMPKLEFLDQIFVVPIEKEGGEWVTYLQILPRCLTDSPVEQCQGHLLRVLVLKDDEWKSTRSNEPLDLTWSTHDSAPRTLHPSIDQRLNVLWASNQNGFILAVQEPIETRWVFNADDTFCFDIAVTAKDCPPISISVRATITERRMGRRPPEVVARFL
jgi:hypothetical protein